MRTVTPIQVAEIPLVESSYLRGVVLQIWEDMAVLLDGSLLIGLSALPAILLVLWTRNSLLWVAADFTVAPAWVACCYLAGRTPVNRKPYLADFFPPWSVIIGKAACWDYPSRFCWLWSWSVSLCWLALAACCSRRASCSK